MKVLVIVAHPDDEVLGMGGTIKKIVKNGDSVKIVIMATGITSRRSTKYKNQTKYDMNKNEMKEVKNQIQDLKRDAVKAAKILGVTNIEFLDFPDNEMDSVSNLQVTKEIERIIDEFKPEIIYTHNDSDVNIDHRVIYNATITATRPTGNPGIKEVISFEVPSSTEWNFGTSFTPNIFVDISKELKVKLNAMSMYKNEIRKFPHPRSIEGLEVIARRWGTVCGCKAAEAFFLVRKIRD